MIKNQSVVDNYLLSLLTERELYTRNILIKPRPYYIVTEQ